MGLLDALLGGAQGREDNQGFLQRFEQGPPWEGYSDQEVLKRYGTVAGQASAQEYQQAASEAFARMSPEQRVEFGQLLQRKARERQLDLGGLDKSGIRDFQDAQHLAQLTGQVHEQPGLLRSILGGSGEAQGQQQAGLLSSPIAKAALAGIAAMAIKKVLGARAATAAAGAEPTAGATGTIPGLGERRSRGAVGTGRRRRRATRRRPPRALRPRSAGTTWSRGTRSRSSRRATTGTAAST